MSDAFQRIFGAEGLRDKAFLARWKKYPREYLAAYRDLEADWVRRVGLDAARRVLPRVYREAVRHQISAEEALRNLVMTRTAPAEFRRVLFRLETLSDAVRFGKPKRQRLNRPFPFSFYSPSREAS
jgi:hypothetical protein